MKTNKILLAGVFFVLAGTSLAHAGTKIMATGPGARFYPMVQALDCNLLNANKTAKSVTIDVMDYFGQVIVTSGPLILPSFTGATVTDAIGDGAWCRFTVDGSPKKYRGTAVYRDGSRINTVNPAN